MIVLVENIYELFTKNVIKIKIILGFFVANKY